MLKNVLRKTNAAASHSTLQLPDNPTISLFQRSYSFDWHDLAYMI